MAIRISANVEPPIPMHINHYWAISGHERQRLNVGAYNQGAITGEPPEYMSGSGVRFCVRNLDRSYILSDREYWHTSN